MKGTVEEWATESLLAARQAYQVPRPANGSSLGRNLATPMLTRTCMWCVNGSIGRGSAGGVLNECFE